MAATPKKNKRLHLATWVRDRLWSESGGHCQNPECRVDLLSFVKRKHVGELAHIIPASDDGPRAEDGRALTDAERALPENILLLCPTCHVVIDKTPGEYPPPVIHGWKLLSQEARAIAHGTPVFTSRSKARSAIEPLLSANKEIFNQYGPKIDVFDDDRADQWRKQVKATLLPNSKKLLRLLAANRRLLTTDESDTVHIFTLHIQQLQDRHLKGDWMPGSVRFPLAMASIFEDKS
ncbi:HNH endonuclease [Mycolicibacterium komossense]|uniref:HNH endonuclease n=1 Tax=Mycolicibacterium komossense TaxID=1779 RepID=A0ABT3CI17_9MYCO|nr:HNH endonuclease [Mycolicibacterium komossense]MCV7229087.1 hypothetical protein [Mycolicibacterium komossense]